MKIENGRHENDFVAFDRKKHGIRESSQQASAHIPIDEAPSGREIDDSAQSRLDF
jgi:hypothetical protein